MKKLFLFLSIAFFTACSVKLIAPTQDDIVKVSAKYPGVTLADLNQGEALYQQKCSQCHSLKNPASRTEGQWENLVPQMAHKAEHKEDVSKISQSDQDLILKYLAAKCAAPAAK